MIKALVLGELCEDILLHNPAGVEVMGQKTWAKDIVLSAGGSTYYTGAALLHLGADVKISSVLGTDEAGDRVYNQMMLDGLNICHTERLPGRKTTKSMMVCDGGDKQFIGCTPMLPLKIPEWLALKGSDLFYIAGYTLYPELWEEEMVNLCCKAKRHGVCIAMDSQLLPIVGDNLAQISKGIHVPILGRPLENDVGNQGAVQKRFRFCPEWIAFLAFALGVGNQSIHEFQNIGLVADIRQRVIVHGF